GVLRELLGQDYEIVTARTGEAAIELARKRRPAVVILDLQLPTIDGIEVGRWIKRELGEDGVAILVLTALAAQSDIEAVAGADWCDAFMAKPASLAAIQAKVRELIEARRAA